MFISLEKNKNHLEIFMFFIRQQLRKIDWLARFYRKHFTDLPFDRTEEGIRRQQQLELSQLVSSETCDNESPRLLLLVMDIEQTEHDLIVQSIESIIKQNYPHWCLLLKGAQTQQYSKRDNRIYHFDNCNVLFTKEDIVNLDDENSPFIATIDAGDLLHPFALQAMYQFITPTTDVIYSDHDVIDGTKRHSPCFKPQWNRDLFFSTDYMANLTFFSIRLFQSDKENGFDWLTCWEKLTTDYRRCLHGLKQDSDLNIQHLPYLLYHQRIVEKNAHAEHIIEDRKALTNFLATRATSVEQGLLTTSHKINWLIPKPEPLVSIIIPTYNGKALVQQCIESVYQTTQYTNFEILLIDNQSDDQAACDYFQTLAKNNKVRLLSYHHPFNYSAINNFAVEHAKGSILVLLNNDIEVISPDWLTEIVANVNREDIGCVGAMLYYPNDTVQHAGVVLGLGRCAGHSHKHYPRGSTGYMNRLKLVQNYSAVTAACLGIRKTLYQQVGGLNDIDLTVAFNDVDLCIKVEQAGYRNLWSPYIELYHHESISRGSENTSAKRKRAKAEINYMQNTWQLDTIVDPAYHPLLTIEREDFTI